jgi:hypothetical protein
MITLVFHGAEVFDSGDAARLITLLDPELCLVAGIMARAAAEESGLPVRYDGRKPSVILAGLPADRAVLIHRAKNETSAHRFGSLIATRLGGRSLVMIDPGTCRIFTWMVIDDLLCRWISEQTGYQVMPGNRHQVPPPDTRSVGGCIAGEPVFVNGIIIGYATDEEVIITVRNGTVEGVSGIILKEHGIEKLMRCGIPDLAAAWCKSGNVRVSAPKHGNRGLKTGRVAVIDHSAMACYDSFTSDICGILSIGDDTTSICGHIGCFRGIPVLGITDGDIDGIVAEGYAPGSVILEACHERDDDLGREIAEQVSENPVVWDDWVDQVIRMLGSRVREVYRESALNNHSDPPDHGRRA